LYAPIPANYLISAAEVRPPKPVVAGSSPAAPASFFNHLAIVSSEHSQNLDPSWTQTGFTAA
jgi:hypothetical protein